MDIANVDETIKEVGALCGRTLDAEEIEIVRQMHDGTEQKMAFTASYLIQKRSNPATPQPGIVIAAIVAEKDRRQQRIQGFDQQEKNFREAASNLPKVWIDLLAAIGKDYMMEGSSQHNFFQDIKRHMKRNKIDAEDLKKVVAAFPPKDDGELEIVLTMLEANKKAAEIMSKLCTEYLGLLFGPPSPTAAATAHL